MNVKKGGPKRGERERDSERRSPSGVHERESQRIINPLWDGEGERAAWRGGSWRQGAGDAEGEGEGCGRRLGVTRGWRGAGERREAGRKGRNVGASRRRGRSGGHPRGRPARLKDGALGRREPGPRGWWRRPPLDAAEEGERPGCAPGRAGGSAGDDNAGGLRAGLPAGGPPLGRSGRALR